MKRNRFWGLHADIPSGWVRYFSVHWFLVILVVWYVASTLYLSGNPQGKLVPSFGQMADRIWVLATEVPRRADIPYLWTDIAASMQRILQAVISAAVIGFMMGVLMGFYPIVRVQLERPVTIISNMPILAILPIVMISFGTGELFKFVLMTLGIVFVITRDVFREARAIPNEQVTKALSLGASNLGTVFRLMVPQLMPRLLQAVRLALPAAWLFLLAAEFTAAQEGLGYRIFLVRRYLDMATIIPYVMIITALAYLLDSTLQYLMAKLYPWYQEDK